MSREIKEINPAQIIVDLMEMRANVNKPMQADRIEKIENVFQYNFINVMIANLVDKYEVSDQDVKDCIFELRKEELLKELKKL